MPITPYFFYAQKDLAQHSLYLKLNKRIVDLIGKTHYLPCSALLLETDAYARECMLIRKPCIVRKTSHLLLYSFK